MSASRQDQQFCLRWNSFHANMASSFHALRSEEDFVDVTLAAEGQLIKAHRVILSSCSPFFKEILKNTSCQHPVVVLHEVRAAHVRDLLSFMYQGHVNLTPEAMPEFLRAAQALHVKGLFEDAPEHADLPPEGKENVPQSPGRGAAPPLLDSRLAAKRAEETAQSVATSAGSRRSPLPARPADRAGGGRPGGQATPPAAKRPRVRSPPPVKTEPGSPAGAGAGEARESPPPLQSPLQPPQLQPAAPAKVETAARALSGETAEKSRSPASTNTTSAQPSQPTQPSSSDPEHGWSQTSYPFPCPFCEKSYTSWGFRRRHIKAFHTAGPTLKCKWCWKVLPSHGGWCEHVTREHHLSAADAQHAIQILDEANLVLQSSEPLRLDSLVDMVKRRQRRAEGEAPEEVGGDGGS